MIPFDETIAMLWIFSDNDLTIDAEIIVRLAYYDEKIVKKQITDKRILYFVGKETYHKWKVWYALKCTKIKPKSRKLYEVVYKFDTIWLKELSNLAK